LNLRSQCDTRWPDQFNGRAMQTIPIASNPDNAHQRTHGEA